MAPLRFRVWNKQERLMSRPFGFADMAVPPHCTEHLVYMQSTGLVDNNGVEIFEGDVVEWNFGELGAFRDVVEWDSDRAAFVLPKSSRDPLGASLRQLGGAGVVGNVYEQPEPLLLGKEGE